VVGGGVGDQPRDLGHPGDGVGATVPVFSMLATTQVSAARLTKIRRMAAGVDDIRTGDRFLTLHDTNELHRQARSFLEEQLRSLLSAQRNTTIVCTHFWPTLRPWPDPAYRHEPEWYYMTGSDLDALIAECGPRHWLCGHAHTTHQVTIGTTQISSNPRAGDGPGNLNPDFRESYVVEL
jgi:hypothetical protein